MLLAPSCGAFLADLYRASHRGVVGHLDPATEPNLATVDPRYGKTPKYNSGAVVGTGLDGVEYQTKVFQDHGTDCAWERGKHSRANLGSRPRS